MDVGSVGTQGYSPIPEPRTVETPTETVAAVEKPAQVKNEPEKPGENEEKGLSTEKINSRQAEDMLAKQIKEANKKLAVTSNELHYSYHKPTRSVSIKVVDVNTKEVIREIPPQKDLDALAKVWELAGILVDEKK